MKALELCDKIAQADVGLTARIIEKVAALYEQNGQANKASELRLRMPY